MLAPDGVAYPDEVFQSLEQAHRLLYGSGYVPWEWSVGARHPLFVWLLVGVMRVGAVFGLAPHDAARWFMFVQWALTAWFVGRLAIQMLGAPHLRRVGLVATSLFVLSSWSVFMSTRALSETACAWPLVAGLTVLSARKTPLAVAGGALLISTAVMLRLQVALICPVILASYAIQRAWRPLATAAMGFGVGAMIFGALDAVAWGDWFHSAVAYLRFNVLEGRASEFGTEPAKYYLHTARASLGGVGVLLLAGLGATRKGSTVLACIVVFVGAHLAIPHKEWRFLYPVFPLGCALAGVGLELLARRWGPRWYATLMLLAFQPPPTRLTAAMVGISSAQPTLPLWDVGGSVNRLLEQAGQNAQVCGVDLRDFELGYSGAYAWFHSPAPLYDLRNPAPEPDAYNAVISRSPALPAQLELAHDGAFHLVLVRDSCVPHPIDWTFR